MSAWYFQKCSLEFEQKDGRWPQMTCKLRLTVSFLISVSGLFYPSGIVIYHRLVELRMYCISAWSTVFPENWNLCVWTFWVWTLLTFWQSHSIKECTSAWFFHLFFPLLLPPALHSTKCCTLWAPLQRHVGVSASLPMGSFWPYISTCFNRSIHWGTLQF